MPFSSLQRDTRPGRAFSVVNKATYIHATTMLTILVSDYCKINSSSLKRSSDSTEK
jgi:hypothetical protein